MLYENLDFETWTTPIIRPKSRNSNLRHDGILSIGKFMLMVKIILHDISCPVTRPVKYVLPISVATRNFLFIFLFQ
jgi:hypothetical protein